MVALVFFLSLSTLHAPGILGAQGASTPQREISGPGLDPYEVELYRGKNYINPVGTWKLHPGMRMLLVPHLPEMGGTSFSVRLGAKVNIYLFQEPEFSSTKVKATSWMVVPIPTLPPSAMKTPTGGYLVFYHRIYDSVSEITGPAASMIVFREDVAGILGAALQWEKWGRFFPLPESPDERLIAHDVSVIPVPGEKLTLRLMAGGSGWRNLGLPHARPRPDDIEVILQSENGIQITFPGPDSPVVEFKLHDYGFSGTMTELTLKYKGPNDVAAYRPSATHRAPAAPEPPVSLAGDKPKSAHQRPVVTGRPIQMSTPPKEPAKVTTAPSAPPAASTPQPEVSPAVAVPDLAGQWKSNIGSVYHITQHGKKFEWTVKSLAETGKGTIDGTRISAFWKGPKGGSGSAKGTISGVDPTGTATKIQWNNGVLFFR